MLGLVPFLTKPKVYGFYSSLEESQPHHLSPQAAPANVVGTNASRQILPEGATVVRRPGEVPRIPDLDADRPSDSRAAQRPELVAPWTQWDESLPKGEALPNSTPEEKAKVK